MIEKDPFETLGLPYGSKESVVKSRYKELAKYYHPDLAEGNAEKMKTINEAYEAIKRGDYHAEEYYHPPINTRFQQQEENAATRAREAEAFRQSNSNNKKSNKDNPQYIPVWYWHGIPLSKKQYILLLVWKRFIGPLLLIVAGFFLLNFIWGQLFDNTLLEEIKTSFEQTGDFFHKASENSLQIRP